MPSGDKRKPAKIIIEVSDADPITHNLADYRDWGIMFENVLEVRTEDDAYYYPLDSVKAWTVRRVGAKIAHFSPVEIYNGVKRETEEDDRRLSQGSK